MERRLVYPVREAPDRALAHLEDALDAEGFRVEHGREFDLNARRGTDRVLVGLAPHPDGLVARIKGKSLVPGRSQDLLDTVERLLREPLGPDRAQGGDARA